MLMQVSVIIVVQDSREVIVLKKPETARIALVVIVLMVPESVKLSCFFTGTA